MQLAQKHDGINNETHPATVDLDLAKPNSCHWIYRREPASLSWRASKKAAKEGPAKTSWWTSHARRTRTHTTHRQSPISQYPSSHRCLWRHSHVTTTIKKQGGRNGTVDTSQSNDAARWNRWPWVIHTQDKRCTRETSQLSKLDYSPNQSNQATELRSCRTQERQDGFVTGPEKDNAVGLNFVGRANSSHGDNEANQTHIDNISNLSQTHRIVPRKQQAKQAST